MMKSVLKAGVCVSCGRESGRYCRSCPYCGEQVWQPVWRRVIGVELLPLPPLLVGTLAILTRPDWTALARAARSCGPVAGFLFAGGIGLLALPYADDDLVVSSRREQVRWQAVAVGGSLMCGVCAAFAAVCLCFGREVGIGAWLLGSLVWASVAAAPYFFRVPWRAVIASALIVAAIAVARR